MSPSKKARLDKLMAQQGLAESRQKAQALIMAGKVRVNGVPATKPGQQVDPGCDIQVSGTACPYVSRGGIKLAAGLDHFNVDPSGWICADIGASTGGFTDCLLERGAARVYAIDVGYGQLAWKLRQDERVVVMERTNARHLKPGDLAPPIDLAVVDASFISLKIILPPLLPLFRDEARIIALIKPQFEAGREHVGKGGVVRDPRVHEEVVEGIRRYAEGLGLECGGVCPSPILGPKGNREFLAWLTDRLPAAGL